MSDIAANREPEVLIGLLQTLQTRLHASIHFVCCVLDRWYSHWELQFNYNKTVPYSISVVSSHYAAYEALRCSIHHEHVSWCQRDNATQRLNFGCKNFHPDWNQCCKWLLSPHTQGNWNKVKELRKNIIFYYKEQL